MNINLNYPLYPFYKFSFNFQGEFREWDQIDNRRYFVTNQIKLGDQWHYANKPIWHSYNSLGYRTKDLDYYKDKDFILVIGCSHTEGNGLADDEVWHYHLKQNLNLEVLNAGISAIGPDGVMLNSLLFLKNANLRPKAVIIQWPSVHRYIWKGDSALVPLVPSNLSTRINPNGGGSDQFNLNWQQLITVLDVYKAVLIDDNCANHNKVYIEITRLLWKLTGIPYYDFSMDKEFESINGIDMDHYEELIVNNDWARDFQHYGHLSHKAIGEKICDKLKSML